MLHQGTRTSAGDIPAEISAKIDALLTEFIQIVAQKVESSEIRRAVVRSMLTCSTINILDAAHLFVAAQKQTGMPSTLSLNHSVNNFPIEEILEAAKWEFGFDDPFVIQFPAKLLDQTSSLRATALQAIAESHIQSEVNRVERQMSVVQISPIFGPAAYGVDPRLAFVLMPFTDELTNIYNAFVKPTVEDAAFGLICRRADDIKSNKAIIQDIWKSICEARLIIADLSGLNPNVMYELGIAHTLGKETVLIYQRGRDVKFPFDLSHIRRIEYNNDALGGKQLESELRKTLESILTPTIKSLP
jgi:hypothetical protein